ncbi:hypothetical protein CC86DRAFT_411659 [Ophiobolus disseminans]|uniref:CBM1 domain-containing protein n=1 Tax=Ophiobolus disseminans TaxID=1469910 RepID=A0A6A6ZKT0_9PLEO|nr:hypothetical protein CC86DRAFT_411659 [Ophiobolus disseminans]
MPSPKSLLGLVAVLFLGLAAAAPVLVPSIEPAVYCGSGAKTGYCGSKRSPDPVPDPVPSIEPAVYCGSGAKTGESC